MDHIQQLRSILDRGFTQGEIAARIGVSIVSLNAWVNGRAVPRPKAMARIDALHRAVLATYPESSSGVLDALVGSQVDLSETQLEQILTFGGDTGVMNVLRSNEIRRALNALRSTISILPSGLWDVEIALLEKARVHNAEACLDAFAYPLVLHWIHAALKMVLGVEDADRAHDHLASFPNIVAAIAWRAGVDFEMQVVARDGLVVLPGVGSARVPPDEVTATVRCVDARLEVVSGAGVIAAGTAEASYEWSPLRKVQVSHRNIEFTIVVDETDVHLADEGFSAPYARCSQLDDVDYKNWSTKIQGAWEMLVEYDEALARSIAVAVCVITPVDAGNVFTTAALRNGYGALLLSEPESAAWTAQGFIEEFQRMKIYAVHGINVLHTVSDAEQYLNPFIDIPRSFDRLIETVYAIPSVARFWYSRYESCEGSERLEAAVNYQLRRCWREVLITEVESQGELTELGRTVVGRCKAHSFDRYEVPREVVEFVRSICTDQRISSRLMNVATSAELISQLSSAWVAGSVCPVTKEVDRTLDAARPVQGRKSRRRLMELGLLHPEQAEQMKDSEYFLEIVDPYARKADLLFATGDYSGAESAYLAAIGEHPDDMYAWAGLATTICCAGGDAINSLGRFPEIVYEVHAALRVRHGLDADPLSLATWLEPLLVQLTEN